VISFFVSQAGAHTIRDYLTSRGETIAHELNVVSYEELSKLRHVPPGVTIFSALDHLTSLQSTVVARIRDQLAASQQRVLNHPQRSLGRYDLLQTLHRSGRNSFAAFRASEAGRVDRFPVFIRNEHLHNGSLTPLLYSRSEVQQALRSLMARGRPIHALLIVEFCDTSRGTGLFPKYSAFKIGDAVLPRYFQVSTDWMVKAEGSVVNKETIAEERNYLESNPHESWLREIFALARIDYGRIDYGLLDGVPQVWEINTNPTLARPPRSAPRPEREQYRALLDQSRQIFHDRFRAELRALSVPPPGARDVPVVIDLDVRRQLRVQARAAQRRDLVARGVTRIVESTWVQRVKPVFQRATLTLAPLISHLPRRS
jgi:hypothetical protein